MYRPARDEPKPKHKAKGLGPICNQYLQGTLFNGCEFGEPRDVAYLIAQKKKVTSVCVLFFPPFSSLFYGIPSFQASSKMLNLRFAIFMPHYSKPQTIAGGGGSGMRTRNSSGVSLTASKPICTNNDQSTAQRDQHEKKKKRERQHHPMGIRRVTKKKLLFHNKKQKIVPCCLTIL